MPAKCQEISRERPARLARIAVWTAREREQTSSPARYGHLLPARDTIRNEWMRQQDRARRQRGGDQQRSLAAGGSNQEGRHHERKQDSLASAGITTAFSTRDQVDMSSVFANRSAISTDAAAPSTLYYWLQPLYLMVLLGCSGT